MRTIFIIAVNTTSYTSWVRPAKLRLHLTHMVVLHSVLTIQPRTLNSFTDSVSEIILPLLAKILQLLSDGPNVQVSLIVTVLISKPNGADSKLVRVTRQIVLETLDDIVDDVFIELINSSVFRLREIVRHVHLRLRVPVRP